MKLTQFTKVVNFRCKNGHFVFEKQNKIPRLEVSSNFGEVQKVDVAYGSLTKSSLTVDLKRAKNDNFE